MSAMSTQGKLGNNALACSEMCLADFYASNHGILKSCISEKIIY